MRYKATLEYERKASWTTSVYKGQLEHTRSDILSNDDDNKNYCQEGTYTLNLLIAQNAVEKALGLLSTSDKRGFVS